MDLSIIIPTIRVDDWQKIINNIELSCKKYSFEIIFVGPYYNDCIEKYKNIKYVRDFGSPNRCQQIGLILSEGKFVTWLVDDYDEGPDNIDNFLDMICDTHENTIVVGNYDEAGTIAVENFSILHCYGGGANVDPSWVIFNVAFLHRSFLEKMGGFNCLFHVTCIGHTDLAVRCQHYGAEVINGNMKIGGLVHMPGISGDHAPIHNNQLYRDQPIFTANTNEPIVAQIDIFNWKKSARIWDRFND
jgi:hypothetical protein